MAWRGKRQGVDGACAVEGAAHHDGGGQRGAEDFQDPALPLGEQQRPAAEHQRVGRPLGAYGETRDRRGRQVPAVRVGDRAYRGDDVTAGRAHAQPHRYVTAEGQLPAAARFVTAYGAAALGQGERRRAQGLRAAGGEHREPSGRGAGPRRELGAGARSSHRERHQARAGPAPPVEEDALQDLAVVARGVPDTDADTGATARRHESSAAR